MILPSFQIHKWVINWNREDWITMTQLLPFVVKEIYSFKVRCQKAIFRFIILWKPTRHMNLLSWHAKFYVFLWLLGSHNVLWLPFSPSSASSSDSGAKNILQTFGQLIQLSFFVAIKGNYPVYCFSEQNGARGNFPKTTW